jgi:hypothetical protein
MGVRSNGCASMGELYIEILDDLRLHFLYMLGKCFSQRVVNSYLKVFVIWKHGRIWFIGNVDIFNISVPGFFGRKIKKSLE